MDIFFNAEDNDIAFFLDASRSKNTKRSTNNWISVFSTWAKSRELNPKIETYAPQELNKILERFYVEIRKTDGKEYEPSSLRIMLSGLDRHLKEISYGYSISRDELFRSSKMVLESKARQLRLMGKGKVPNRARSLTSSEEMVLWEDGQLGDQNSRSLVQTLWWNNCLHFGMRGREEYYHLNIEDFKVETDNAGRKYIYFDEGLTKTRKGGLNFKPRLISPKMYQADENCPVELFLNYKSRRPIALRNSGPLYLSVIFYILRSSSENKMF